MNAALMIALIIGEVPSSLPKSEAALRALELEQASARGKHEKSLEAIEKVIRHDNRCPRCPDCAQQSASAPREIVTVPVLREVEPQETSTSQPSAPPPRIPWWVWAIVAGAAASGMATGIAIGVAATAH